MSRVSDIASIDPNSGPRTRAATGTCGTVSDRFKTFWRDWKDFPSCRAQSLYSGYGILAIRAGIGLTRFPHRDHLAQPDQFMGLPQIVAAFAVWVCAIRRVGWWLIIGLRICRTCHNDLPQPAFFCSSRKLG